ncbi:MAG: SpoIIE family protein phosphatase [Putridiphycobacter sp.]|nr:SpoIIE family protein phosphatase [Putridiphycobacter sp.]
MRSYAVLDIVNYPQFMDHQMYYDYLYEAGAFQIKQGNQDVGIGLHLKAVEVAEMIGNDTLLTSINKRLGITFSNINNPTLAKKYLFKSLAIAENLHYDRGISSVCMTIGNVYKNTDVFDSALVYYNKSIKHAKLAGYQRGIAGNYNNLGNLYVKQKDYDRAIDYFLDAIPLNEAMRNMSWLGINYSNLGGLYADLGKYDEALFYINKGLKLRSEIGDSSGLGSDFHKRSDVFAAQKRYKQAFLDLKTAKEINNRFANNEKLALAADIEGSFHNAKKEAEIKRLRAEKNAQDVLIAAQNQELELEMALQAANDRILWGFAIILIGLIGVFVAFIRHSQQRKKYTQELSAKNSEIELVNTSLDKAKHVLTVKNEEIMDSISYAKRIQAAILPSEKYLHQSLKEAFVLYLPKDIVAGDFYWTEIVGDTVLFAVADCTGHGVPGAMVSVICNNALNDTIKLKSTTDPGEILDCTTDLVLNQFSKSEEEVKDGMDIGLCAFNRKDRTLKFAGANIPLWLVRANEVKEIKATRQPVGRFSKRQKFVTHNVAVEEGDMVYLSSDGFADQFGGINNKKFMKKNFKNLLAEISQKPLNEQNNLILDTFSQWKNRNEQVDDICIMGVKFKAS